MAKAVATPSKKKPPVAPKTATAPKSSTAKKTTATTQPKTLKLTPGNPLAALQSNIGTGTGSVPVTYAGTDLEQTATALRLFMGTSTRSTGASYDQYHTGQFFLNMLTTGSVDQVRQLQEQLFSAGMYGTNNRKLIRFGDRNDPDTRQALSRAVIATYQAQQAGARMSLSDMLNESAKYQSADQLGGSAAAKQPIRLTDPAAISEVIDKTAPDLIGRSLTDDEKQQLITAYQSMERGFQDTMYAGGTGTEPDLGSFIMQKTKQMHPGEEDLYGKFKQSQVLTNLINSTSSAPQPFEVHA